MTDDSTIPSDGPRPGVASAGDEPAVETADDEPAVETADDEPDLETADSDPVVEECLCPLGGVMDLLSRKYAMQAVCVVAAAGPIRYGEIETAFGEVSSSTLSARLSELTDAGLLDRQRYDEIPPRVEYGLTDEGAELAERLVPLLRWAEDRG